MKKSKVPLYAQIRAYIKSQIDSGQLQPGDQIPTEVELMERFNVSRVTTTNALKQLVEEGLISRVAGKGTFVQGEHPPANKLPATIPALAYNNTIGFIMSPARDLFTFKLLTGIEERCRNSGIRLMIRTSVSQEDEILAIQEMVESGVKGMIIYPQDGEAYNETIVGLKLRSFPFVLVDRYLPGIKTNAIFSDNYSGGKLGTEYLISLGHQQIGIVSSSKSKTSSSEDRFSGYLNAAKAHNLPIRTQHWLTRIDDHLPAFDAAMTEEVIKDWLAEHPEITAVFALQSPVATLVATAAERLGKRVPQELSILSFDSPGLHDLHKHLFSHIEQNLELMGQQAVDLLLRTINDADELDQITIPITLVEGRSTAALQPVR